MKQRKKPAQHIKRVRTRRGKMLRLVNKGVPRRAKRFGSGNVVIKPADLGDSVPKQDMKQVTEAYIEEVKKHLKHGHNVRIPSLGILKVKNVPAKPKRMGRNPFTGEQQMFKAKPASKKIKFFPSKELKEEVSA